MIKLWLRIEDMQYINISRETLQYPSIFLPTLGIVMSVLVIVYTPLKNPIPSPSSATETAIDNCEQITIISETIRGKTITFIRLYKIGNVEQALHGAVLVLSHTLCVNIIVHSDFKCNCSDLIRLIRGDITSHGCRCNKVFLRGNGVILDAVLSQATILDSLCCSEVSILGLGELTAAFPALKIDRMPLFSFLSFFFCTGRYLVYCVSVRRLP